MDPPVNNQTSTGAQQPSRTHSPQPQHMNGFTLIPPNENRRTQTIMTAQKEEENFQKFRETQRAVYVQPGPQRLGGSGTMSEARQKQFVNHRTCKLEKKSERLEERRELEEIRRRGQLYQDHFRVNSTFLDNLEAHGGVEGPQFSASAHLEADPQWSWTRETKQTPDNNMDLMSLKKNFPDCSMDVLQEILEQCNGDYDSAYALLS
ncbi:epithelial-stromal interaction protein 1 isoform X3 [Cynoglossus semilaevis]|uniref:epithelial-stromal interaction protein 1 isoform X3 n=1 Tax=Cynoglossus semilaevis TaxID=244447 RepID=UPI0007DC973E|nr:epithelial-stromal interaction protein 1 isoform X3 [Cynoglossus semilaevis]